MLFNNRKINYLIRDKKFKLIPKIIIIFLCAYLIENVSSSNAFNDKKQASSSSSSNDIILIDDVSNQKGKSSIIYLHTLYWALVNILLTIYMP